MGLGVVVDFTANLAQFQQQLDRVTSDLGRFGDAARDAQPPVDSLFAKAAAGISVAGIAAFVKTGIDAADAFNDLADRTGVAIEALAGLDYAAKLGDTSIEAVAQGLNKLSIYMVKNAEDAKALGLATQDPAEALIQFADIFASIEDEQQRAALGATVLGKSYAELAPLLLQGADGLRENVAIGQKLSGITTENAKAAGAFNDKLDKLDFALSHLSVRVAGPTVDALNSLLTTLNYAVDQVERLGGGLSGAFSYLTGGSAIVQAADNLQAINDKIREQKKHIADLQSNGAVGALFDGLLGRDDLAREQRELEALTKEREKLVDAFAAERDKQNAKLSGDGEKKPVSPSAQTLNQVIGGGDNAPKRSSGSRASVKTPKLDPEFAEAARIFESTRTPLEKLDLELDRYRSLLENGKITTDTFNRAALESMTAYTDATGALDEYNEMKREAAELTEAMRTPLEKLDAALASYRAQLEAGNISLETYNRAALSAMKNLGFYADEVEKSTDQMDAFAEQAARNIQDSFADFLFDPFADGLDGMVVGFGKAIQKMLAEQAAAQLLGKEGLNLSGLIGSATKGATSFISDGVKDLFSGFFHDGGTIGAPGGKSRAVDPIVFYGAPRFHSGGFPGLKSDEVPAILQVGERVLSKKEVAQGVALGVDQKTLDLVKMNPDLFSGVKKYHDGGPVVAQFQSSNRPETKIASGAMGGRGINININLNGSAPTDRKSASNLAYQIGVETQRAINRNS
jgi:hypothetical protein